MFAGASSIRCLFSVGALACLSCSEPAPPAPAVDEAKLAAQSRELTQTYRKALGGALKAGMGQGLVKAVRVCNERAPKIAGEVKPPEGFQIGRTSLKLRNPSNAPDAWERKTLESFESKKKAGAKIDTLEAWAVVEADGKRQFRYMKAIGTEALCLACHGGADVPDDVVAELGRLYPDDAARGFAPGDIRGAFTVRKSL